MFRTLLVPLDGSPFGEHALPLALSIAERAHANVQLAHVHVPVKSSQGSSLTASDFASDSALRDRESTYLDSVVKRLAGTSPLPIHAHLLTGLVADAIYQQAEATTTDLIVMTTHGRGPLTRAWLGSIADQLIRRPSMLILLIRPQDAALDLTCKPIFRHVLIPLDGSELAEQILEPAIALGQLMEADYTLLRAIEPLIPGGSDPSVITQLQAEAQAYLDGVAERLRARSLRVQTKVAVNRPAATAILEAARVPPIDLIAMQTHGRGELARQLLGSVADQVLRAATMPVLVHHGIGN